MKKLLFALFVAFAAISCTNIEKYESTVPYDIVDGKIVFMPQVVQL